MPTVHQNVINIIKYMRKSRKIKQAELSKILDCTQAQVSYIENGKRSLSKYSWDRFCHHFSIDPQTSSSLGRVSLTNENDTQNFKLPSRYSKDLHFSGKLTALYIDYFIHHLGRDGFEEFCKSIRVNPYYFVNLRNATNLDFILRLTQELIIKKHLSTEQQITEFARFSKNKLATFLDERESIKQVNSFLRFKAFILNMHTLDRNHEYIIEKENFIDGVLTFSLKPKNHVDHNLWSKDYYVGGFMEKWVPKFLTACSLNEEFLSIEQTHSICHGNDKAIYQASLIQ